MTPKTQNKAPETKQGIPAMSAKSYTRIVFFFAALLLLLSAFQNFAIACPPICPPCYAWNGSRCVNMCDTGQYCCDGTCCNNGTTCCSGHCCDPDSCMTCQNKNCKSTCNPSIEYCCEGTCIPYEQWCCDGTPCDTECCGDECCSSSEKCCSDTDNDYCCGQDETCCDGSCCNSATELCCDGTCCDSATEYCCDGTCCQLDEECCDGTCCDPDICEECVGGQCPVCGGRPGEVCCNGTCCDTDQVCCEGTCCDKVWTKETIDSDIEPCSDCDNDSCYGTSTEIESYEKCLNVGVGSGEHCECTNTWQPVGYRYNCMINWDVTKMLWCAAQGAWCVVECAISGFDPATCANCLAGIDCCGGPCERCDFVEECEKDPFAYIEVEKLVFSSFGC